MIEPDAIQAPSPTLATRYNWFVSRHEVAWELGMGMLALVWVALGFLIDQLGESGRAGLEIAELALTGVFVAEFGSRLLAAQDRRRYLRAHWIDAVALVPPVRGARLLRLLRLLRLVRAFAGFYRAALAVERLARHRGFAWLIVAWLGVMVGCSAAVYVAEHGTSRLFDSPFDALWWGVVTLTTVGYGDTYPATPEGRLAAMILMLLGIGLFSAITATVTSFFLTDRGRDPEAGATLAAQLQSLARLRQAGALTDDEVQAATVRLVRAASEAES